MEVPSGRAWRRVEPYAQQKSTGGRRSRSGPASSSALPEAAVSIWGAREGRVVGGEDGDEPNPPERGGRRSGGGFRAVQHGKKDVIDRGRFFLEE